MAKKSSYSFKKPEISKVKRDSDNFSSLYNNALYYAHYEMSSAALKKETIKYIKKNLTETYNVDDFSALEDYCYAVIGKFCFILNNSGDLPANVEERLPNAMEELHKLALKKLKAKESKKEDKEDKPTKKTPTIQDRLKAQAGLAAAVFDGWIDEFTANPKGFDLSEKNPESIISEYDLKQGHVRYIQKFYENDVAELQAVFDNTDSELKEAYGHLKKSEVRKLLKLYEKISIACDVVKDRAKANKKPRAKKSPSKDKIVSKLKYMKEFTELSLVSINPLTILNCKELWVYNTKTRKLGHYVALDEMTGLSVKGASITDFSTDKSVEKTLRKPAEQLAQFKKGTKASKNKFFKGINATEKALNGRLNANCVLLKVF